MAEYVLQHTGAELDEAVAKALGYADLPTTYQQVEYIETTGTQFINTGFTLKADEDYELDVEATTLSSSWTEIGGSAYTTANHVNFWKPNSSKVTVYQGSSEKSSFDCDEKMFIKILEHAVVVNDVIVAITQRSADETKNFYIGDIPDQSYPKQCMRIYNFKGMNRFTGAKTIDLIPCYRKSDSVIGMYDLVSGSFLTNAGTGSFSKGNDV